MRKVYGWMNCFLIIGLRLFILVNDRLNILSFYIPRDELPQIHTHNLSCLKFSLTLEWNCRLIHLFDRVSLLDEGKSFWMNPIIYLFRNFIVSDYGARFLPVMLYASLTSSEGIRVIFLMWKFVARLWQNSNPKNVQGYISKSKLR